MEPARERIARGIEIWREEPREFGFAHPGASGPAGPRIV